MRTSIVPVRGLLTVAIAVSLIALTNAAGTARAAHVSKQVIRFSGIAVWGSMSKACSLVGIDQPALPNSDPYVCVSVRFSAWRGYHKGRLTLTSPHALDTTFVSFHGTTNRPVVHTFSTHTADQIGAWTVALRLDGRDAARKTFTILESGDSSSGVPTSASIGVSLAPAPAGYTSNQNNGVYEIIDTADGAQIDLSRFAITPNSSDGQNYIVSFYVKATKIPSADGSDDPSWYPSAFMFRLVASNQHPYYLNDTGCASQPEFDGKGLYDGESTEGWVCSDEIAAQNTPGSYMLTWDPTVHGAVPVLDLTLTTPAP